jgi:hypothetical protein
MFPRLDVCGHDREGMRGVVRVGVRRGWAVSGDTSRPSPPSACAASRGAGIAPAPCGWRTNHLPWPRPSSAGSTASSKPHVCQRTTWRLRSATPLRLPQHQSRNHARDVRSVAGGSAPAIGQAGGRESARCPFSRRESHEPLTTGHLQRQGRRRRRAGAKLSLVVPAPAPGHAA